MTITVTLHSREGCRRAAAPTAPCGAAPSFASGDPAACRTRPLRFGRRRAGEAPFQRRTGDCRPRAPPERHARSRPLHRSHALRPLPLILTLAAASSSALSQGTADDYRRAAALPALTRDKVYRARVRPHWLAGGSRFWYRNDLAGGRREYVVVDADRGVRRPAFDHARLAASLAEVTGEAVDAARLPVEAIDLGADGRALTVRTPGAVWACNPATYALQRLPAGALPKQGLRSEGTPRPSSRTGVETSITFVNRTPREALVLWIDSEGARRPYGRLAPGERRDQHTFAGHVWLVTDPDGVALGVFEATDEPGNAIVSGPMPPPAPRLEHRAGDGATSPDGTWVAFVREHDVWLRPAAGGEALALTSGGSAADGYRGALWWSPDSRRLVAIRTKAGQEHKVYIVESSPPDQVQPRLHDYDYRKPGDVIPLDRPHLFDVRARREVPVDDALFPNPWAISDVRWDPDSRRFTFVYNQRGHQVVRLVAVDAATGAASAVVDERSRTFVDYAGKLFLHRLDATGELLWMSERDGWNHLYLYDARSGAVKEQVTRGPWVVRGVDRVDEVTRQVWFRAGGLVPGEDPYHVHYCRVNLDGTGLVDLTPTNGTHTVSYSPDGRFLIDTRSRVDLPPVTELRRTADGALVRVLERADSSALLATGWRPPERFAAVGRDGQTPIFGIIVRPTRFDPSLRYPVVECIYAGPQGSYVPKAWSEYLGVQEVAELGFVVVQIDGMGTSNRSKAFHDVCWKNLGDAGLPDRIAWMRAAARSRPWMDLSRVGIYGGSAGGQNALRALLAYPDFYKVGVADCGCHDNRMDKIWWNELWMGWPVGPEYAAQSNVTNAGKLRGKLLLVVGEMDTNVDPASTMQVVNALVKADKDFDLLVMPGVGHGSAETPYGRRRRQDFLVRHLLGVEPRRRLPAPLTPSTPRKSASRPGSRVPAAGR
ncbi:MAG: DPP IV N-terminal domain-containing protein [Chthonomonadales bacterium]|nr:DPP IV N-terminal domain-containing protein [Chthonomonadales bacterium]